MSTTDAEEDTSPGGGVNPSRPFILRPVATSLFMLAILLSGIVAYRFLPLSALPEVDYPTIQVRTLYPGASPDVMAFTVTGPLERQFGQMAGLNRMSSASSAGASVITLQFKLDLSLDVAEQEVQAAINAAGTLLPSDLPAPPLYAKINPADAPIMSLGVTSKTRSLSEVQDLVDQRFAKKISQISGVGLVSLSGGQRPAVRIQANVQALAARGLSLDSLRSAIAAANVNSAKGSFDGPTRSWSINANDQLATAEDYKTLIIAYRNGAPVRLSDVANIVDSAENTRLGAWMNRTPAIIIEVQRQPGANVISTVDTIKAALPDLERQLPADVHVTLLTDRTAGIRASVADVQFELVVAVFLVMLAIFMFLGSPQATVVASIAVPLSLVGSFVAMYLLGFSINNLTLMALTIASGFVVDDAIVVIENISRHLKEGETPLTAALKGSREIGFTIISLTISLVAVLIPLLFMGDVVGRLFREFAVTLAVTILISAVVALTLVPMLSARWLKAESEMAKPKLAEKTLAWFERVAQRYGVWLDWVLMRQRLTLLVFMGTLALTALLFVAIPKGLFPEQDTGQLKAVVAAGQDVSFQRMSEHSGQGCRRDPRRPGRREPELQRRRRWAKSDAEPGTHAHQPEVRRRARQPDQADSPPSGARARGCRRHPLRPAGAGSDDRHRKRPKPVPLLSAGRGLRTRSPLWAGKLTKALQDGMKVRNVTSDVLEQGRAVTVAINRNVAARLGISTATIDSALYNAFGQRIISTIFTQSIAISRDPGKPAGHADQP